VNKFLSDISFYPNRTAPKMQCILKGLLGVNNHTCLFAGFALFIFMIYVISMYRIQVVCTVNDPYFL